MTMTQKRNKIYTEKEFRFNMVKILKFLNNLLETNTKIYLFFQLEQKRKYFFVIKYLW